MNQRLVSIITPLYNRENTIDQAIKSVLAQTYKNWEYIIVDDGSITPFQLNEKFQNDRIQVIRHPSNQGAAAARNTGLRSAKGKYIAFLDADDEWFPEKLEKQIAFLETSSASIGGCVTACRLIYPNQQKIRQSKIINFYQQSLVGEHFSAGSTLVFKKTCLKKVGLQSIDLKRLEDWEWQINFSRYYTWGALPEVLASVYINTVPNFKAVKNSVNLLQKRMVIESSLDHQKFNARCLYELIIASFLDKRYFYFLYYLCWMSVSHPIYLGRMILRKYFNK